ncbi:GNAT family N-acetyltransferase [Marinibactrum halimedae]|uniref:N-acetyltransferase n=2 Tax=Marinibactrum halimedae TaxID=1444977 RepID=A0AA37T675_9GAMM|nr:GNAT family N-acetyltransferase [Marinibactrum halimedae]GLS27479.1 N-acetyltransferase [Marinibactrum halimedae]
MNDMIVNLYHTPSQSIAQEKQAALKKQKIYIQRALPIDKQSICEFVRSHFFSICPGWEDECATSLYRQPTSCFVAIHNREVIGFACYDGSAKGVIGPIGVAEPFRKQYIATVLLHHCLTAMKMEGYAYAVITCAFSTEFYQRTCNAHLLPVPEKTPDIYQRLIHNNPSAPPSHSALIK